jgi:hypothetical protein
MTGTTISILPTETLQKLKAQCSNVVAEICGSVTYNSDVVDAIRGIMGDEDVADAIYSLRIAEPEVAMRLVTAAVGVLVDTVNLTNIQVELQSYNGE